jgi:hypothetical protein
MQTSEQLNELAAALAKAQAQVRGAIKDANNPHFKSSYADLASVWDACREAITANGLSVVQAPEPGPDGAVCVTTRLMHSSGQWMEASLCCRPMKNDAQGVGSVITYLRRYALAAMVGVAPEDDDGEGASGRGKGGQPLGDITPKPVEKPEWKGPLKVTALKDALRNVSRDVMACTDEASLNDVMKAAMPLIKQAEHDLPDWIKGDGQDIRGLRADVEMMRAEFKSREAMKQGYAA